MKKLKTIYRALIILLVVTACTEDRSLDFLDSIKAPTNVAAVYNITQDNSGLVTITPTAEGASSFDIHFADTTVDPENVEAGKNVQHTYVEGIYDVKIVAYNANGDTTEAIQQLMVSFQAPKNLVVTLENDIAVSKQVNITANADFATSFEFYSGEAGIAQPVATANIGDALSYQYTTAGIYSVKVIAKGGAIETTEYTMEFEVTEILAPIVSAGTPPARNEADVISIFSDAYTDVASTDLNPNWGQQTVYTAFDLNGDAMIQYSNLNYQGIQIGATQDISTMEFLHLDVWTADATDIETYLISVATGEKLIKTSLTKDAWTSINIPLSEFTAQGLSINDIHQFKFVGAGSVFIDNLYFYKAPSSGVSVSSVQDFEGTPPAFTAFGNIAGVEVVSNPDATGVNTTANVAQLTKTAGSEVWAGAFFETSPLDLVNYNKISVKTWSPKLGAQVKLKLENADASIVHEVDLNTTVANSWEELVYDFSDAPTADYVKVVLFFDFGNAGDDSVYYYDEVNLVNNSGASNSALGFQDFEGTAPEFTAFGNIAGVEVISNPDATGANTTANVAQLTKTAGSEVWAGAFFEVATLDLNNYSKISVKTWSPINGAQIKMKLENADASIVHEVDLNSTVANSWEELVYDFSDAPAADYVKVVLFFDFGNAGDGAVYYYDELALTN
ncbi:PKD domain protein [Polaribacter sp. PL03]|uniref:PKD domain protein n=1 Tax=Polaribacter sp. PL03 TaxID=3088353 RepID=UPI0029D0480C|nr:PKD domain protein [Polaribacter sp. PL03]MDX6746290.1 PKD domain protein [Polaribacter sp. PL03]